MEGVLTTNEDRSSVGVCRVDLGSQDLQSWLRTGRAAALTQQRLDLLGIGPNLVEGDQAHGLAVLGDLEGIGAGFEQ